MGAIFEFANAYCLSFVHTYYILYIILFIGFYSWMYVNVVCISKDSNFS